MKISRKFVAVICTVMMTASLTMLAACGGGGTEGTGTDSSGSSGSSSTSTKVYNIATDTTFAPFEFTDVNGQFVGIDMDILAAIAEDQGFDYQIDSVGFNAALQAVTSGQADGVIAGMSITDERKETFDFSDPYFDSGVVMGVAANDNSITSYADLAGKKVAIKLGTEGATFAESIQAEYGFEIVTFDDSSMMYEDVIAGNSQACFEDYPVLGYAVSQDVGLKIVTEMERGSSYGFAVAKGQNAELLAMFDAGLKNIKENGTYQKILDKYIVTNAGNSEV